MDTQTYDPLVDLSQQQYSAENVERLGTFMAYVNDALKEDGVSTVAASWLNLKEVVDAVH